MSNIIIHEEMEVKRINSNVNRFDLPDQVKELREKDMEENIYKVKH